MFVLVERLLKGVLTNGKYKAVGSWNIKGILRQWVTRIQLQLFPAVSVDSSSCITKLSDISLYSSSEIGSKANLL